MASVFKDFESQDIEEVLSIIERSFDVKFASGELKMAETFGQFCELVINKIQLQHDDSSTDQQAFYKLRNAIAHFNDIDKSAITPDTLLTTLFKRKRRRSKIAALEKELGVKLNILEPHIYIVIFLTTYTLASLITLFFNWQIGLSGFVLSIVGFNISHKMGKQFNTKTVGELTSKMVLEHYVKSRRNIGTVNRNEIAQKIEQIFTTELCLEPSKLTRDSSLV